MTTKLSTSTHEQVSPGFSSTFLLASACSWGFWLLFSATETKKIDEELEKQFNEGLHSKFNRAHHQGLGFDTKVESKAYTKANNTRVKFGDDDEPEVVVQKKAEESKASPSEPKVEAPKKPMDDKLKFKKMVFVKSSS